MSPSNHSFLLWTHPYSWLPGAYSSGPNHGAVSGVQLQRWAGGDSSAEQPSRGVTAPTRHQQLLKQRLAGLTLPRAGPAAPVHCTHPPPPHPAPCHLLRPSCCRLGRIKRTARMSLCPAQVPVQTAGTGFSTLCSLCKSTSTLLEPHRVRNLSLCIHVTGAIQRVAGELPSLTAAFHPAPPRQALRAPGIKWLEKSSPAARPGAVNRRKAHTGVDPQGTIAAPVAPLTLQLLEAELQSFNAATGHRLCR